MERDNPPPYSAYPAAPGMAPPHPSASPPPIGFAPTHGNQPPLQPMKPPYASPNYSQTQHTQVVITRGPQAFFGPNPVPATCPSCHAQIISSVTTEPNTKTHLFALVMCLFGLYCCCCIPYCVDSCQSQNHYCPNCQAFLGTYQN